MFQDKGFIGFFVGQHQFTIECYDDNNLFVRTVDDQNRAWYIWLTDQEVSTTPSKDLYTNLIWQEEFNYNGKIDDNKWVYEVRDQWYNEELQATTDRLENVIVQDGKLKLLPRGKVTMARVSHQEELSQTVNLTLHMVVLILEQSCRGKKVPGLHFGFGIQL